MSVTYAQGFMAAGLHCGVKRKRPDLAIIATQDGKPVPTAAVFTKNRFAAAPVQVSRAHLQASNGLAAGVIVNSGNANAGTGEPGIRDARAMSKAAAAALGCTPEEMLVCSTGLIGKTLPIDAILSGVGKLAPEGGKAANAAAAKAILTTDTVTKQAKFDGEGFSVGAIAKGSGMLRPDMATMLAFITTDADVSPEVLSRVLRAAVDDTFNTLTVDGAMSTNDTVILMASGRREAPSEADLEAGIRAVCEDLALQMARDAEGRTKIVRVNVTGAASDSEARQVARSIAENQLIKCSWHGSDPYWGRILCEAGAGEAQFDPDKARLSYGGIEIAAAGVEIDHDSRAVAKHMAGEEIEILLDLALGAGAGRIVTVDLGPGYLKENAQTS